MRWLLGVFLTAGGIVFSHCALAYELDLDSSFSQSEGKLIVIDVFGKVNRSDVSVEDVAKLLSVMNSSGKRSNPFVRNQGAFKKAASGIKTICGEAKRT